MKKISLMLVLILILSCAALVGCRKTEAMRPASGDYVIINKQTEGGNTYTTYYYNGYAYMPIVYRTKKHYYLILDLETDKYSLEVDKDTYERYAVNEIYHL